MKLTNPEKLILLMLSEIQEKLGINDDTTKLITKSIYSNNTWALSWELNGVVGDSPDETPKEVKEVFDILDMWGFIEDSYSSLNQSDKDKIEQEAEPFGKYVRFIGFDGNNETEHLSVARFLIEDMNRFSHFKGRELNSHSPSLNSNLNMFSIFEQIRPKLDGRLLHVDEIIEILKAKGNR